MIFSYIYNILKFKKWELLCIVTILIALKCSTIITFRPNVNHLTELHKCPICFGTSACEYSHEVDIILNDLHSIFSYYLGVKNVFFGSFNENKVVLKKLAQSSELNEFDKMLCENANSSHVCSFNIPVKDSIFNINFRELIEKQVSLDFERDNFNRLSLCPSVEHLNNLLRYVYQNNKDIDPKVLDINIWTLTVLNPEPLILQVYYAQLFTSNYFIIIRLIKIHLIPLINSKVLLCHMLPHYSEVHSLNSRKSTIKCKIVKDHYK